MAQKPDGAGAAGCTGRAAPRLPCSLLRLRPPVAMERSRSLRAEGEFSEVLSCRLPCSGEYRVWDGL